MDQAGSTSHRVLLATDDSESARQAEAWVARLRWSKAALDRLAGRLSGQALSVTAEMALGHPLDGTLRAADTGAVDLIVAARPSRGRSDDPFAEKVARSAPTSVLIVPHH